MSIRILIADDHQMLREGLRAILEQQKNAEVVGEASDGRTAVEREALATAAGEDVPSVGGPTRRGA